MTQVQAKKSRSSTEEVEAVEAKKNPDPEQVVESAEDALEEIDALLEEVEATENLLDKVARMSTADLQDRYDDLRFSSSGTPEAEEFRIVENELVRRLTSTRRRCGC